MQAYMKSEMPFRGVQAPGVQKLCRDLFPRHPLATFRAWRDTVLVLWRAADFREERYAAIALTGHQRYAAFQTMKTLAMYEEMILSGAWWDYVDDIASHRLGGLLRRYPQRMRSRMRAWSRARNLWKRRSAILCQLRFKGQTDLDLLYSCIEPSMTSAEFFLQKAIGWALREHAWTDPDEVIRYVTKHRGALSNLSKREALKNVLKAGQIAAIP